MDRAFCAVPSAKVRVVPKRNEWEARSSMSEKPEHCSECRLVAVQRGSSKATCGFPSLWPSNQHSALRSTRCGAKITFAWRQSSRSSAREGEGMMVQ